MSEPEQSETADVVTISIYDGPPSRVITVPVQGPFRPTSEEIIALCSEALRTQRDRSTCDPTPDDGAEQ